MKTVLLLLSSEQFSFPLIRYLVLEGRRYKWKTCIGSMFDPGIADHIKEQKISNDITFINITDFKQCDHAIRKVDLVIAMMPDVMLMKVADICLFNNTSLISPSRMTRQMAAKKEQAQDSDILLLMECGFSPGLDHITAKKVIDSIRIRGGTIAEFKTNHGSIVEESGIDNPWQFKLTEPAAEVVGMGKRNNRSLVHGQLQNVPYYQLFDRSTPVNIQDHGVKDIVAVPAGDSLYYRKIYELQEAHTVVKGRLLRKGFDRTWSLLIKLGLTDNASRIDMMENKSFYNFLSSLLPYAPSESLEWRLRNHLGIDRSELEKLKWLGLFDDQWLEGYKELTPAYILQHLLEKKFSLNETDRDCIMMQHELLYELKDTMHHFKATMVAYGENKKDSAIAKGIGFTTGAAAKAFLLGDIKVRGLHLPTIKEIYDPMLSEMEELGVGFHVEEKVVCNDQLNEVIRFN